jgi:molecular chaperone GrpE
MEDDREQLRARADAFLDLAQRSQAEFANYKRRLEAERETDARRVQTQTVAELLPLIDDLDRAVSHLPPELADHLWAKGVAMLAGRLHRTLERYGFERIGRVGEPFDPERHEAVAHEPRPGRQPGTVAEVYRHGYRTKERLIRPAQVVVAAQPAGEPGHLVDERV